MKSTRNFDLFHASTFYLQPPPHKPFVLLQSTFFKGRKSQGAQLQLKQMKYGRMKMFGNKIFGVLFLARGSAEMA